MVISLLSYGFPMVFTASQYHPSDLSNLRDVCSRNLPPGALAGNFLATTWGNNEVNIEYMAYVNRLNRSEL